jgi:hypothetical protein
LADAMLMAQGDGVGWRSQCGGGKGWDVLVARRRGFGGGAMVGGGGAVMGHDGGQGAGVRWSFTTCLCRLDWSMS